MDLTNGAITLDQVAALQIQNYLPDEIRLGIEYHYYRQVNAQASFTALVRDPDFLQNPMTHVGLYSDHGVVHVRDVAAQILRVLDVIAGVLVSGRSASRLGFMKAYGTMTAYLHDIGMRDFTSFGREMHPEFATQEVFTPRFDPWIDLLWNENWGNLAWRLKTLAEQGGLKQPPKIVLREMLSMANCHSKSKIPVEALNDRQRLRGVMQETLGTDLHYLHDRQKKEKTWQELFQATQAQKDQPTITRLSSEFHKADLTLGEHDAADPAAVLNPAGRRLYQDFENEAFGWLVSPEESVRALAGDVIDTLRALRCADALRQRGTVLKTSGGYQIFTDRMTANAVYSLRDADGVTFLLEVDSVLGSGEANLASSELTRQGDMRVSFFRGSFSGTETVRRAAFHAAVVVNDVQGDIIESFRLPEDFPASAAPPKSADDIQILLESVDDNLEFADQVCQELVHINSALAGRVRAVPSLQSMSEFERSRYLQAEEASLGPVRRREILEKMAAMGTKTQDIDPQSAFLDARCFTLKAGETLTQAGSVSGLVYVPMGDGLSGTPLGGYSPFTVPPWVPLNTAVIRGATRNATIVAEQVVSVLAIPKEVYLRQWHRTFGLKEFTAMLLKSE